MQMPNNWFRKNIRSLIAAFVVIYIMNFYASIFILQHSNAALIDRLETSVTNILMFILGYYFSANHTPTHETTTTTHTTDTIK